MYHTDAIILKRIEWGEADLLITALTRDFGKIRLLAQGARKHGAKLQGHIEPGSCSSISFVIGRNGYRITTAQLDEPFFAIRQSLSKLRARDGILQTLDQNLFEERDRSEELFYMTTGALDLINRAERLGILHRAVAWFHVRFSSFLGVLPPPDSIEGMRFRTLSLVASTALGDVEQFPISEEMLRQELAWFMDHVRGALSGSFTVEARWFAVYPVVKLRTERRVE